MYRIVSLSCAGFALLIGISVSAGPASAVVYCRAVGVPRGCVCLTGCRSSSCRRAGCWPRCCLQDALVPKGCVMR